MAVWVFSTGSIVKAQASYACIRMTVDNRTAETQHYRIIIWNTSDPNLPKTSLTQFEEDIPPNNTDIQELIIEPSDNVTRYEVEFRFSSPHMVPWIYQIFTPPPFAALDTVTLQYVVQEVQQTIYAGEMFQDSTSDENP